MISELELTLPDFPGEANRTRCFNHIINLVAKSMLRLFDVPKKKANQALNDADRRLHELAEDLDLEELNTQLDGYASTERIEDDEQNVDEIGELDAEEQAEFRKRVRPVQLVLVKVLYV
jgi:hypothetical protein